MRKVIAGRVYDTETATEIASYSYGYSGDFQRIEETLYRTAKGAYFIAGGGGPMTHYATSCGPGQGWSGSCGLYLVTEQEAREFAEAHGSTAAVEHTFPVEEG